MAGRGCFITLEGGEGAGKSTLARALVGRLAAAGHEVVLTREPGGVPAAEAIRSLVLSADHAWRWTPLTEALLFNAARAEHLEQLILPALSKGQVVVCDRFADSTRAYQLAGGGSVAEIDALESLVVGGNSPDITFLLDMPVETRHARLAARGAASDAFEKRGEAFHECVRREFLEIAKACPERVVILDAAAAAEVLVEQAMARLGAVLGRVGI